MTKHKKLDQQSVSASECVALISAIVYLMSVLRVAHHTASWVHDGTSKVVEAPALIPLSIAIILALLSWSKRGGLPNTIVAITLTICATSSIFWLSGLRANFF